MNTLLTIIKGSVFSQYDFHNAQLSSYGAHCFTLPEIYTTSCSACFEFRLLMLLDPNNSLFPQIPDMKIKNEHSMHEKSIKLKQLPELRLCNSPEKQQENSNKFMLLMLWANEGKHEATGEMEDRLDSCAREWRLLIRSASYSRLLALIRFGVSIFIKKVSCLRDLEESMCARRFRPVDYINYQTRLFWKVHPVACALIKWNRWTGNIILW